MTFLHFQFRHDSASLAERRLVGFANGPEAGDVHDAADKQAEAIKSGLKEQGKGMEDVKDLEKHQEQLKAKAADALKEHKAKLEGTAAKNTMILRDFVITQNPKPENPEAFAADKMIALYASKGVPLTIAWSEDKKTCFATIPAAEPKPEPNKEQEKEAPKSTQEMDANPDKFEAVKQDVIDLQISEPAKLALVQALMNAEQEQMGEIIAFAAAFPTLKAQTRGLIISGMDMTAAAREKLLQGKDDARADCERAWAYVDANPALGKAFKELQKEVTDGSLKEDAKDLQKRAEELGKDLDPSDKDFELKVSKIMMSTGAEYKVVGNKVVFTVPEDPNDQAMNKFTGFVTFLGALVEKLQKGLKKEKGSEVAAAESGAPKRFSEKETPGKSSTKEKPTFDFELVPLKDADRENLAKFLTTKGKPVDAGKPGESLKFTDKTKQEIAEIKSLVAAFERGAAVAEEVGKTMAEFNQNNRHSELEFDQAKNEFMLKTVATLTVPLIEERLKALGIPFEKTDGGKPFILKNNPDIIKRLPEIKTKLNEPIKESLKDYQRRQLATFHEVLTQMGAPPTPIDANMTNDAIAQSIIGAINVYGRTKFNLGVASGDGDLVEVDDDPGLTNNNDIYDDIDDRLQKNPYKTIQDLANQHWTQNKDQSNWGANSKAKIPEFCRALKKAIDGVNADYASSEPVPDNFD